MRLFAGPLLFATNALAALTYKGVDWSSLLVEEKAGKTYKNTAGTVQPLETILKNNGVNTVRQRIWVNPSDGNYNLDYNIQLAKRAKAAGLKIYLDFHYSDTWADPSNQKIPSGWPTTVSGLQTKIYDYTKSVLDTFQSNGISLDIVSIGNEITPGLLRPAGYIGEGTSPPGAGNVASLLKSASSAVKASTLSTKPKIMVHLDNGWNWGTQQWWYDAVLGTGKFTTSDFDIQGVSYYPFYNSAATLASLGTSLTNMKNKYGRDVQVVETDWPTYCPNPKYAFPSDAKSIPFSVDGQKTWIKSVASKVSGAGGNGLFYWEPAWIDNAGLGSSCGYNLMVSDSGQDMGSLSVFGSI